MHGDRPIPKLALKPVVMVVMVYASLIALVLATNQPWRSKASNVAEFETLSPPPPQEKNQGLLPSQFRYKGGEGEFVQYLIPSKVERTENAWRLVCPILARPNPFLDPILRGDKPFSDFLVTTGNKKEDHFTLKSAFAEEGNGVYIIGWEIEDSPAPKLKEGQILVLVRKKPVYDE